MSTLSVRGCRTASGRAGGRARGNNNDGKQGRNNNQSTATQSKSHKQQRRNQKKPVRVFTSAFASLHAECQAARYKVHGPGCECVKLREILSNKEALAFVPDEEETLHSEESTSPEQPVNGLIVVPQTKTTIRSMYFCWNTHQEAYEADPHQAEVKLRKELFQDTQQNYKVSCAACLLEREPNGFACVSSTSKEVVDAARDVAQAAAQEKASRHADHAHFTITLPRSALWKLVRSKTRNQKQQAQEELVQHLSNQDVLTLPEISSIVLGHHLTALLFLTDGDKDKDFYWLVMGYDYTHETAKPHWTLDLPGGKRHLGETSLEAAIRETEEEISLVWDRHWIRDQRQSRSDRSNRYFMLTPPTIP